MNYYNEFDPGAAAWLRELINQKQIPEGHVDTRSITEVRPEDLAGYVQCHFFAGIGGWAEALRLAGWPDDQPVWTGSCPCQPFSSAGKQKGTADERHLWPEFLRLIAECRPPVVFGEQVCSAAVVGRQPRKGPAVPAGVSLSEPGSGPHASRTVSGAQEGHSVRPREASGGFAEAYRRGLLRGEWASVQPRWWEDVGQSVVRPGRLDEGLHARQRESGVARGQQCVGGLGGREDARNSASDHGSPDCGIKRALREARAEFDDAVGGAWGAGVRVDLESLGYAFGACDVPAAGVGAPHIRQRLYWVADAEHGPRRVVGKLEQPQSDGVREIPGQRIGDRLSGGSGAVGGLADVQQQGLEGHPGHGDDGGQPGRDGAQASGSVAAGGGVGGVAYPDGGLPGDRGVQPGGEHRQQPQDGGVGGVDDSTGSRREEHDGGQLLPGTVERCEAGGVGDAPGERCGGGSQNRAGQSAEMPGARHEAGFWSDSILLPCRDGKARRVEPTIFPLAHGVSGRVGLLRGAGNAIVPQVAATFVEAFNACLK